MLSAATRRASDNRAYLTVTAKNAWDYIRSMNWHDNLVDRMNACLLYIRDKQKRLDKPVDVPLLDDFPLVLARDSEEFYHCLYELTDRGLLSRRDLSDGWRLTPLGWNEVAELGRVGLQSDQAFVAMSFNPDLGAAFDVGIHPALKILHYDPTPESNAALPKL